ncbi:hypothetical protein TW85_16425 [Marinomonas sp. S3726]|uniref:hypothetical protein n=1 Tax=Marinomonas sp. S3726 TaxID=579484 RepID=UPI0005F9C6DC|nr:hypothetical protein [Marinomonas sp. S3726]KJZ11957.1 hypothetical protein TW85_16425 [Marinomonas sp. S3726]
MIYLNNDEANQEKYFSFINDVVGILAITLSATALQFKHPQPFAYFFIFVLFLWTVSKIKNYSAFARINRKKYKGFIGGSFLIWKMKIYLLGFISLTLIASGHLSTESIYTVLNLK